MKVEKTEYEEETKHLLELKEVVRVKPVQLTAV